MHPAGGLARTDDWKGYGGGAVDLLARDYGHMKATIDRTDPHYGIPHYKDAIKSEARNRHTYHWLPVPITTTI